MFEGIMGDLNNLGGAVSDFLGGTGGQLIGTGLSIDEFNKITDIAERSAAEQARIGREAQEASAFRPFTVSTGFGGVTTTPEGGFTTSLSPAQAAQQQQLQGITSGLLGNMGGLLGNMGGAASYGERIVRTAPGKYGMPMRQGGPALPPPSVYGPQPSQAPMAPATGGFGSGIPDVSGITGQALGGLSGALTGLMAPTGQREADVYERIRATQRPEEERARLALEERLQSQGRTGLRTAQFGGAPEQLALAQAQEEAKARASLGALEQAQAEQQQQLGLAQGLFGLGSGAAALPALLQQGQLGNIDAAMGLQYLPEQQLLSSLAPAINLANISNVAQRQGAGYMSEAGISGLEDLLQAEGLRSQNLRDLYSTLLGAQANQRAAQTAAEGQQATNTGLFSGIGGIVDAIGGFFDS